MKQPTCLGDELVSPLVIDGVIGAEGLTKREYMATSIMAALLSSPAGIEQHYTTSAECAVMFADALLAELAKVTE